MRAIIYKTAVFVHILSAMFWIGGMLFTAAVLVPASRNKVLKSKKGALFSVAGKIFSRISWILFLLLIVSGLTILWARGFTFEVLIDSRFWESAFGQTLAIKLQLFAAVLIISGLHDFWLGPKAAKLIDKQPNEKKTYIYRKLTRWAGRVNLLLGLLILYYAITLVRL